MKYIFYMISLFNFYNHMVSGEKAIKKVITKAVPLVSKQIMSKTPSLIYAP